MCRSNFVTLTRVLSAHFKTDLRLEIRDQRGRVAANAPGLAYGSSDAPSATPWNALAAPAIGQLRAQLCRIWLLIATQGDARFESVRAQIESLLTSDDRIPTPELIDGQVYNFWQDDSHIRGLLRRTSLASLSATIETVIDIDSLATVENVPQQPNWPVAPE